MSQNVVPCRSVFSIFLTLLAVMAVASVLLPSAAYAGEGTSLKGTFTVQAELLMTTCAPGDTNCGACLSSSGIYVEAQGLGQTSLGPMFFSILKCFSPAGGSFGTYAGTFTLTSPNKKDSVTGTYAGQNDNAGDSNGFNSFSGDLTITGGTGRFHGAQGSASFTAAGGPLTAGPAPNTAMLMAFYSVHGKLE